MCIDSSEIQTKCIQNINKNSKMEKQLNNGRGFDTNRDGHHDEWVVGRGG